MKNNCHLNMSGSLDAEQLKLGWLAGITFWSSNRAVPIRPHRHAHKEMIFCLKGELTYDVKGYGTIAIAEGAGLVMPRNTTHVLKDSVDTPGERLGFHFTTDTRQPVAYGIFPRSVLREFDRTFSRKGATPFRLDPQTFASLKELSGYLRDTGHGRTEAEWSYIRILASSILYKSATILSMPLLPVKPQFMTDAVKFLEEHYAEDIGMDDLVAHIGYGRTQLFKLFKSHTHLTPNEFLTRYRVHRAEELLARGDIPIRKVAELTGFSSVAYFRQVFRKYTGRTIS